MPDPVSWLKKFFAYVSRPKIGQVFANKSSLNLNIYLDRKSFFGKILLWSPRNKGRWITSKWFRGHHRRVFWPNKQIVMIEFESSLFSDKTDIGKIEVLKEPLVERMLLEEQNRIESEKDSLYLGPPLDFSLFLVILVIALILGIPLLLVALLF
ncbi:MAG: hypothetical protein ACFFF4_18880 [Candidatus Thorarchaeota archaeon]